MKKNTRRMRQLTELPNKSVIVFIFLVLTVTCHGQTSFSRGEELLMLNQPSLAAPFLESAVSENPSNITTYLYLGIVYEQLGRFEEAIALYRRILPLAGSHSANIANNLGNVYFLRGNNDEAERFYSQAISFDAVFSKAYLGRANTRVKAGNIHNAVSDYEQYLTLEPLSSQRSNIESLIRLIRAEAAAEEMRRILAAEEERRIAEERQRLLDSVSASLQSAADFSQGISSGAESVKNYDGEFELD
ncbi:MAG: tetratricopeptide repeat protein [Treponema sp.]|nr:tetratricopeptide repeat protein [Treponema sp.]MCL2272025.1 tetratricopeptide repeat protein [Treponema sp.]